MPTPGTDSVKVAPLLPQAETWMRHGLNAMLIANHGVGKTTLVEHTAKKLGYKIKIFSCSTMDPFTDLLGVPFASEPDEDGNRHLEMVRPRDIDEAEVIFFDEFNRADPKVHNALMEIIQFRRINGDPLPNLKCCWAAMNPPNSEYNVEELDPALIDRFDVFEDVPARPSAQYLISVGIKEPVAKAIIAWYNDIKSEKRDIGKSVTPRRLEKIGHVWQTTGSIEHVIPNWFLLDDLKLRAMLQDAEREAEDNSGHVGGAQAGPTKRFEYTDEFARNNELDIAEYIRENPTDMETQSQWRTVIEPRMAPSLVKDYGAILSAMTPGVREAILAGMADSKLTRLIGELAKVDPARALLLEDLITDASDEASRR